MSRPTACTHLDWHTCRGWGLHVAGFWFYKVLHITSKPLSSLNIFPTIVLPPMSPVTMAIWDNHLSISILTEQAPFPLMWVRIGYGFCMTMISLPHWLYMHMKLYLLCTNLLIKHWECDRRYWLHMLNTSHISLPGGHAIVIFILDNSSLVLGKSTLCFSYICIVNVTIQIMQYQYFLTFQTKLPFNKYIFWLPYCTE